MGKETRVVHVRREDYDIYIGSGTLWANPFQIGRHGTRQEVIDKFRAHAKTDPLIQDRLMELDGKILGCWCSPLPCHGDVYVEMIKERKEGHHEIRKSV